MPATASSDIAPSSFASGCFRWMMNVLGPEIAVDLTVSVRKAKLGSVLGLTYRSTENLTSAGVTGAPLENRAFRSLNVYVSPSLDTVQDFARSGWGVGLPG